MNLDELWYKLARACEDQDLKMVLQIVGTITALLELESLEAVRAARIGLPVED